MRCGGLLHMAAWTSYTMPSFIICYSNIELAIFVCIKCIENGFFLKHEQIKLSVVIFIENDFIFLASHSLGRSSIVVFPMGPKLQIRRTYSILCAISLSASQWNQKDSQKSNASIAHSLIRCQKLIIQRWCKSAETMHFFYFHSLHLPRFLFTIRKEYSIKALINTNGCNVLLCYAEGNWSLHCVFSLACVSKA